MNAGIKKSRGFTLIEIMVVLLIMGIMMAIAVPSYKASVAKSRRTDAKSALLDLASRAEKFFAQNNSYTTTISAASGLGLGRTTSMDGYYNLSVAACGGGAISRCYLLTASATGVQADDEACASLSLDNVGRKTAQDSAAAAADYCW